MTIEWYLVRTKPKEERRANEHLSGLAADVLLPLIKVRIRRWGRLVETVAALFPCYLFAMFDFESDYRQVRYARGVRDLPRVGAQAAIVPPWIISELKQRCAGGPLG